MKLIFILMAFFLFQFVQTLHKTNRSVSSINNEKKCDLTEGAVVNCWEKRNDPTLKLLLVHYGSEMEHDELKELAKIFEERFHLATNKQFTLQITNSIVVPLKEQERDLDSIIQHVGGPNPGQDRKRLERLWYYYNDTSITNELHLELSTKWPEELSQIDGVLVLSAPQIEGLAHLSGAYILIEYPTEIAWKASDGGSTEYENKYALADRLVHETGHLLGLDHASSQCHGLPYEETLKCCSQSPSKDDVMSYCRRRDLVSETIFYKFEECSLRYLAEKARPALLFGGKRLFQDDSEMCP